MHHFTQQKQSVYINHVQYLLWCFFRRYFILQNTICLYNLHTFACWTTELKLTGRPSNSKKDIYCNKVRCITVEPIKPDKICLELNASLFCLDIFVFGLTMFLFGCYAILLEVNWFTMCNPNLTISTCMHFIKNKIKKKKKILTKLEPRVLVTFSNQNI